MCNQYRWLVGSLVALAMPGAWAGGGRIDFAGAVVTPTCSTDPLAPAATPVAARSVVQRLGCSHRAGADATVFAHEAVDLAMANRRNNRLLDYFASYAPVAADGEVMATLVIRTYD